MGFKLADISFKIEAQQILDRVSLQASEGEFLCLLGPSGCGKTTTLRILAGLETPDSGEVFLKDRVVHNQKINTPPERRRIGFLFQDFALFPHLTVRKNVAFGLRDQPGADKIVSEMLEAVQMSDYALAMPSNLSGGQQQRIALARAMAPQPDIMLLDEPFSGLDTALREALRDITRTILKRNNTTTVMVTHDPEEAMFMADKIALMDHGKVVEVGTPKELYHHPKTEFTTKFLGDAQTFAAVVNNNRFKTRFGIFQAQGLVDRTRIRGYVRPEHLKLTPLIDDNESHGEPYRVLDSHCLGEKHLVALQAIDSTAPNSDLSVKVRLYKDLRAGDLVRIGAQREHLVIFS